MKQTIGIRREDKNVWERRAPLTPDDCREFITQGIRVIVQPSDLRCFCNKEYSEVGCEIKEDLKEADLIVCVKEVPKNLLMENKSYLFFSHTIKGQKGNMPMLKEILRKNIRLFDYECIKDNKGTSKASSRYAGIVGAIDILQGIGQYLLFRGMNTPFIHSSFAYMHNSSQSAKESVKSLGEEIKTFQLPRSICPFIIGKTSNSEVSNGAMEILSMLPHEVIEPEEIEGLFYEEPKCDRVYITTFIQKHMYEHVQSDRPFSKEDLYQNPQNYKSTFAQKFVPYLSVLINGMYWDQKFPRLISLDDARELTKLNKFRLFAVTDVTCDLAGSIELLQKFTSVEKPFYLIDTLSHQMEYDFNKMTQNSLLYHSVDHLPCELPRDATIFFSNKVKPYVKEILNGDIDPSSMSKEITNACITWNGKFNEKYRYLEKYITST